MQEVFGVPMTSIMVALLITFGLSIGVAGWVWLRQRVIFRMGIRNIPRRPAQTILIVIGLMLSTLIISAALTTGDTLNYSINSAVYDLLGHTDEMVVPSTSAGNNEDEQLTGPQVGVTIPATVASDLEARLQGNENIDGIMGVLTEPVPAINPRTKLSEPALALTGLDPARLDAFGGITDVDGKEIDLAALPAGSVVLGEAPAKSMDAQVGDTLTIYVNNQPHDITVAAIAPDSMLTGMQDPGAPGGFALPLDAAQQILGRPDAISFVAVSNVGGVERGADASDAAVSALREGLAGTTYSTVPVKKLALDQAELAGNAFTGIFLVLGLFSIAAGVLLIFLIFVLLAAERKPEMGMARAVGMRRRQLTQMFLAEGIAYDLVSALIGAALGVGVAFVIAGVMGQLIGDFFNIHPTASWRSLIVAYTLGVVVTFLTIAISSWRVSRLNIVAAIRDIPEPTRARAGRRWLIFGILGVIVGALLLQAGLASDQLFPFSIGMSLIPLSLAVALRRFGVPARPLYTVASLVVLAYWLMPESLYNKIFPKLTGNMEMFFISGIMMVSAATVAIVWNADILTNLISLLGRTFSRWLPAVKTAVAYPLASKGRTGMTIAMFSLIVFSLVTMSTINANFTEIFTSDDAAGGWDIQASHAPTNAIPNFTGALAENGVDTSSIVAAGQLDGASPLRAGVRMAGAAEWKNYWVQGANDDFLANVEAPLQIRAEGYDSDEAVWQALRENPDLAVVDGFAIFGQGFTVGNPSSFKLEGVQQGDDSMQPTQIEISDPVSGRSQTVTVIGVIDSKVSMLFGVFTSAETFNQVFDTPTTVTYYVKLKPDTDAAAYAKQIRAGLVAYGVQADSIDEILNEQSALSQGFLSLIQGFMALGLVVGIAALGVISFRSVVERRQQIGMLRAIGYQRGMVAASFLIESTMITVLGVLSGAILGLWLSYNLMTSEDFSGTTGSTSFLIPWFSIALFIVISLAASLIMAYIPARKAATVPIADALRYE